ncbi:hypothetical protein DFH06DRAFT_1471294 [Mycena polygramma]|nr:hypothetical protein DFH06DRAFT_1471294 [Mycena polygramma]
MAPIRLASWAPRNTKPAWDWKARGSAELNGFNVAFGIKEYVQNVVGQILKDLRAREWSDWIREDLRGTPVEKRIERKRSLIDTYPGLLIGPHGICLVHGACLPLYILSADIPIPSKSNLKVAIVSFAVDGESTSKANEWAVGEKGKGFILATQHLAEEIDKRIAVMERNCTPPSPNFPLGVSFRVGEQIAHAPLPNTFRFDIIEARRTPCVLPVSAHFPIDIDESPDGGNPSTYDPALETNKMREKAGTILKQAQKHRVKYGLDVDGKSVVNPDEVCITVIGLDPTHEPEQLFSAIYGIIPPPREWRIPGGNVQFFISSDDPRFYHRDQFVKDGIHLSRVSLNYHGTLTLSAERMSVRNDWYMTEYRQYLRANLHDAFLTLPDLAIELALDILADEHSNAFAGILLPPNKDGAAQYRVAFEAAMRRRLHRATELPLHPYAGSEENLKLFDELGLAPVRVSHKALNIMHQSGAYAPVKEYARGILLGTPPVPDFPGLDRLRAALRTVLPNLPADNISVRDYDKVYPTVIWDDKTQHFAFGLPKSCEDHTDGQCLCWIGPVLHDAAKDHKGQISARKLWRAFAEQMGGNTVKPGVSAHAPIGTDTASASRTATSESSTRSAQQTSASASQETTSNTSPSAATATPSPRKSATVNGRPQSVQAQVANSTAAATGATSRAVVPETPSGSAPVPPPPSDGSEAALNRQALSQISKTILGYDTFTKYDAMAAEIQSLRDASTSQQKQIEDLTKMKAARDAEIVKLKEGNKELREDLAYYMEGPPSKRRRLVETPSVG